jgi:hypothetical protein
MRVEALRFNMRPPLLCPPYGSQNMMVGSCPEAIWASENKTSNETPLLKLTVALEYAVS